jgi:hypothetical protein
MRNGKTIGKAVTVGAVGLQVLSTAIGAVDIYELESTRKDLQKWVDDNPDSDFRFEMRERLDRTSELARDHEIEFGVNTALGIASFIPGPIGWAALGLGLIAGGIESIVDWRKKVDERKAYLTKMYGSAEHPAFSYFLDKVGDKHVSQWEKRISGYKNDPQNPMNSFFLKMKDHLQSIETHQYAGVGDTRLQIIKKMSDQFPLWAIDNVYDDMLKTHPDWNIEGAGLQEMENLITAERDEIIKHGGHTQRQEATIADLTKSKKKLEIDKFVADHTRTVSGMTNEFRKERHDTLVSRVDQANDIKRKVQARLVESSKGMDPAEAIRQRVEESIARGDSYKHAMNTYNRQHGIKRKISNIDEFYAVDGNSDMYRHPHANVTVNTEHPSVLEDIPYDMKPHTLDGKQSKYHHGKGVVEVDRNFHGIRDPKTRTLLPGSHTSINEMAYDKNKEKTNAHTHEESHRLQMDLPRGPDTGLKQPNPEMHRHESVPPKSGPENTYHPHDADQYMGGYPSHQNHNAQNVDHQPVHMVEPGKTLDPMESAGHANSGGGPLSKFRIGDLRALESFVHNTMNHEPLAHTARQNYMHYLGEHASFV